MAELTTIARPYAEAVFELAKASNTLNEWSDILQNLATITATEEMQGLLQNPNISEADKVQVYVDILGEALNDQAKNLLQVLAENHRLILLPFIAEIYEALKAEEEKRVKANVLTAFELTKEQEDQLKTALNKKYDANVEINYEVDPSLIGGIKIKVGDWVIDGSVATQLKELGAAITH
ncbi:F0F1 ATP synthase subunit delta [Galenea microaerophila]